jgi:hypothetical protein
MSSPVLEQWL